MFTITKSFRSYSRDSKIRREAKKGFWNNSKASSRNISSWRRKIRP